MKTISTNYKLTTNGKKIRVSLVALFRAVGIGGEVSEAEVPGNVLDTLRVQLVRPGVTGAEVLTDDTSKPCHYYLDGSMLDVSLAGLTGGVHRLTVLAKYGTNCHALLIADLEAPANVLYLDAGDVVMPLARMAEKDTEVAGVKYYAFAYTYGNKLAWLLDEQPQHLRGTVEAYYVGNIAATFEDATKMEGARLVLNKPGELVYDNSEIIDLSPVDTFGSVGGGVDYKTNNYMDGNGRVIMERMEDGSTVILDDHENPIAKREANGNTKFFDANQVERFTIDANGNIHFAEFSSLSTQVASNTQAIQGIAATGGASVASSVIFNDGENAEVKVEKLSKEVLKIIGVKNKPIDLTGLESQNLIVNGDTNKWENGGSHYVVEVNAGEVYELRTATSGYSRICKLSEHNPVAGGDATAFNLFVSSPNQTYTITIEDGQHYLYFTIKPASLNLKGDDGVIPVLSERVTILERDIESIYANQARDERMNDFDWKPFDKPYFVFQLDDSNNNVVGHTDVFLSENVPLCYAALPSNIDDTKLAKMREMIAAGGEVLCHYTGSPTDETPFSTWLNLIRTNLFALQDFGFSVRGLVRADSTQANSVNGEKICRMYFDYANKGMGAAISKQYNIDYWGLWNSTIEQVKAKFDADANVNGLHVYSYHGKGGTSAETWQDEAAMRELLQYIKTNHPNVVFTTYGRAFDSFKTTRIDNIINSL